MFKLESSFRHVMALAPFFNTGDIVVNLEPTFPRKEVASNG
jgi:hypothetical protein